MIHRRESSLFFWPALSDLNEKHYLSHARFSHLMHCANLNLILPFNPVYSGFAALLHSLLHFNSPERET